MREALRLYLETNPPVEHDPLERLIGLVDDPDGPVDVAVNHDRYLYGASKDQT